jgi:cell pole-organizing protein PopZ
MAQPAIPPNASMDEILEILAAIRRTITDDVAKPGPAVVAPTGPAPPIAAKDAGAQPATAEPAVQDMRDNMNTGPPLGTPPDVVGVPATEASSDHNTSDSSPATATPPAADTMPSPLADFDAAGDMPSPQESAQPAIARPKARSKNGDGRSADDQRLLSRANARAVGAELDALAQVPPSAWDHRLDELAREMLRPMLRDWLNRHLPHLVRRLVREEMDRLARARRS